jgi:hypothetical protein
LYFLSASATVLGADGTRRVLQRKQEQQPASVLVDLAEAWPRP